MRNILLNVAVTLDGYIEGPNGEYDWCFVDENEDYGMIAFLNRTDAIFYGRKSYETLLAAGPNPFADKKQYVFSSTLRPTEGITVLDGDATVHARAIKATPGKDIWLFGGAQLTEALMQAGLVDELVLSVHPLLLGNGKQLFRPQNSRQPLQLINSTAYDSGLVQLHYKVVTGNK
ncbi:dihydrofolate reductase family protein [Chitinophagaceae bacterium MMS25-I14]